MGSKLKGKNAITGLGAWFLSIASFTAQLILAPEGVRIMWLSPLSISTATLFILGSLLIYWSIFKRELSFPEKQAELKKRQEYLQELKKMVHRRLEVAKKLQSKAITLPLYQYYDKYLKHTFPYILTRRKLKPVEIISKLARHKFIWNNLYYQSLKDNDYSYKSLVVRYDILYAQTDDRCLKNHLNTLWVREHQSGSAQIYVLISMNNKRIPNIPLGLRGGLRGKKNVEDALKMCLRNVEQRIDLLQRGEDL